ncbi:MAG: hypothetical protein P4M00_21005 [Azospirillaceae bacterium]|nr:hypothetical protein [Azospirillaceae bacterium]
MTPQEFIEIGQALVGAGGDWPERLARLLANLLAPEDTDPEDPVHRQPPATIGRRRIEDFAAGRVAVPPRVASILRPARRAGFRPVVYRVDDYRDAAVAEAEKEAMRSHPLRIIEDDGRRDGDGAGVVVAWVNGRDRGLAEDVARFLQRRNNRIGSIGSAGDPETGPDVERRIDDAVLAPGPSLGEYRDANGRAKHGIYCRRQSALTVGGTLVLHDDGFERVRIYVRGASERWRYTYPVIAQRFRSPMHRWENLHFVGGWQFVDGRPDAEDFGANGHLDAVLRRRKPLASYSCRPGDRARFAAAAADGLRFRRTGVDREGVESFLVWADDRALDELFDLDALIADHAAWLAIAQANALVRGFTVADIAAAFGRLRGVGFADLPADLPDLHWQGIDTILLTGLIYGYPPASTAASLFFDG